MHSHKKVVESKRFWGKKKKEGEEKGKEKETETLVRGKEGGQEGGHCPNYT